MYLLFTDEQEAWNRADEEGAVRGLSYHLNGIGSRYVTAPKLTANGDWALDVSEYTLTEEELSETVQSVTFPDPEL